MTKLEEINKDIVFLEKEHKYYWGEKELTSVSVLINNYKPIFDESGFIKRACAKREGISELEIGEKWEQIRQEGLARGKRFHKQIEHFVLTNEILDEDYKDVVEQYKLIKPNCGKLYCEIPLHDKKHFIAGTADLILLLNDTECELMDWKTNKEINKKSKYGHKLLYPLEHLDSSEINTYSIQLNLYRYMLEKHGYKVKKITLYHINPKTRQIDQYKIEFMDKEIKDLLEHFSLINNI